MGQRATKSRKQPLFMEGAALEFHNGSLVKHFSAPRQAIRARVALRDFLNLNQVFTEPSSLSC
jgi:hypothetical protein